MNNSFDVLERVIISRRSIKPAALNGQKIGEDKIKALLELANWAPIHGFTEPWRFVVFSGDAIPRFCQRNAEMYKETTEPEKFSSAKYEKQLHNGDKASHIIAVYLKRGSNPNITMLEEICAVAAAVQNILLGAGALGIAVLWSTGGAVLLPAMEGYLGIDEEDIMIGLLYMGYTDEPAKTGKRTPIEDKIKWM